jgi:hypothetical protein
MMSLFQIQQSKSTKENGWWRGLGVLYLKQTHHLRVKVEELFTHFPLLYPTPRVGLHRHAEKARTREFPSLRRSKIHFEV